MANGDEDVEYEFIGNPDCGICGALAGTTDSQPIPPAHDNCQCTNEVRCNNRFVLSGSTTRYGPNGDCFFFDAEITVICWDGSESGVSTTIDMGCAGEQSRDEFEDLYDAAGDIAGGVAEDACPDCDPPLVS